MVRCITQFLEELIKVRGARYFASRSRDIAAPLSDGILEDSSQSMPACVPAMTVQSDVLHIYPHVSE